MLTEQGGITVDHGGEVDIDENAQILITGLLEGNQMIVVEQDYHGPEGNLMVMEEHG